MKLNKAELLTILSACKPAIAKKEFIEQACHFIFTGKEIATFNDEICIIYPYETDIKFSVQGEEFYKTIDSIDEDEVEITLKGDNVLVNAKKTQAGMSTIVGEKEKVEDRITNLKSRVKAKNFWNKLPEDFKQGIFLCMFSTSKDSGKKNATHCVATKGNLIVSTDALRASKYVMKDKMDDLLIPAKDCFELVKYDVVKYGRSEGWYHFITKEGVLFNCKEMNGDYPFDTLFDYFQDRQPTKKIITLPKELQKALDVASVFAEGKMDISKQVQIFIEKDKIVCKSFKERGWMTKEIPFKNSGKVLVEFQGQPVFFSQILNKTTTFYVIQNDIKKPDIASFINETFQHIIAIKEIGEK